jgi:hypothetical protein
VKKPWKHTDDVDEPLRRTAEAENAPTDSDDDEVERPAEPVPTVGMSLAGTSAEQGGLAFIGIPRLGGDWDLVITGEAPELTGADELGFVVVEDGDIYMDSHLPDGDVTPLAEAIELQLPPPYRAYGVRQEADLWAVSAREIKLGRFQTTGDELELTIRGDQRELVVDGKKSFGSVPELEQIGKEASVDFFARASRIDGDLWEITVGSL